MSDGITLPFWLFVFVCIFAAIGIVDRVFAPSVRWFFRRRVNRAIDELNQRLDTRIQPFKLTRRQSLIDRLIYDPRIVEAVDEEAGATNTPRGVVMKQAERYAREIVPHFSVTAYFGLGTKLARWASEFVYRVRLGYLDDDSLKRIDPQATVIFVMNHRSNMDYVLVTYMASNRASLSYAVGEWARIWLLQSVIRSMGAYFIRRNSGNELYRKVLGRYVALATREGVTQAVFPEGGLTRTGHLNEPRLGLLSYMVAGFDVKKDRDVVFVPVGINYDRVIEDRILTARQEREVTGRKFHVSAGAIAGFVWNLLRLRLQGKLYRYGYACVSFGEPVSLAAWIKKRRLSFPADDQKRRFAATEKLGKDLMDKIGAVVPALPVALASAVFLKNGEDWMQEEELKKRIFELMAKLEKSGGHVHIPRDDRDYAVSTGLRMLVLRKLVEIDTKGAMRAAPQESVLLGWYANSIAHLLPPPQLA